MRNDVEDIFVQTFEATLRNWLGLGSSGMCVFNETCGTGLAIEHNGDLYSCRNRSVDQSTCGGVQESHINGSRGLGLNS